MRKQILCVHLEKAAGPEARAAAFRQILLVTRTRGDDMAALLSGPYCPWKALPPTAAAAIRQELEAIPGVGVTVVEAPAHESKGAK